VGLLLLLFLPAHVAALTAITDANDGTAATLWMMNPAAAATTCGNIGDWNTAAVTDTYQLRFAQVMSCSHECISADSVSTGNGKVTMEADFDCTNSTTGASNCASGAQSAAFPFTTINDIIQVQER
jgi:hypothetical protein